MTLIAYAVWYGMVASGVAEGVSTNFIDFLNIFIQLNLVLFVFNLLPFPPLDGYRIVEDLVPNHIRPKMTQYESYGSLIFLILVITPLDRFTIQPIFNTIIPVLSNGINDFFTQIFL